jgi:hypothetical protein
MSVTSKSITREITQDEAWTITCHEAGHCVVGVHHRITMWKAERGSGGHGQVSHGASPLDDPDRGWPEDEIARWQQFFAGGAAAEKLLRGSYREYGCISDRRDHAGLEKLRRYRPNGWDVDIKSAMALLDLESIEKIAKLLDEYGTMSGELIYKMLGVRHPW